jgi:hypothetical protein
MTLLQDYGILHDTVTLVAEGLPFRVEASVLQSRLSLHGSKRQINWFELQESMHHIAPACEMVFTPGVGLCL